MEKGREVEEERKERVEGRKEERRGRVFPPFLLTI